MDNKIINAYAIPGVPIKHIRLEDERIKLKGLRLLALCCQYFGTTVDTILISKSKSFEQINTRKYYYYLLNTELKLTAWFIIKNGLSKNNKRSINNHITDVKEKLSINDKETIKIVEELKSYLQ